MHFRYIFIYLFLVTHLIFGIQQTNAQIVGGLIIGDKNEPIPFATIFVTETQEGTISNADGIYQLQLPRGVYQFTVRSMGYLQEIKQVTVNTDSLNLNIRLKNQTFEIQEVKIFPGKEDPAWFIMRKAIAKAPYYRQKIRYYEADMYIKSNFAFSSIPQVYKNKIEIEGRKLKELIKENVTYVIESQNKITFTYPNTYEQKVISKKTSLVGVDEPPVMELMSASFYDERPNQLISPLSSLALKHYSFRYEGFMTVGEYDVFKIRVSPNRKSDELVEGYIYIIDKLWCIYNLDLKGHFEFFEYQIKQQFAQLGNNWLPVSDNINGNVSMLGLKGQFYYGVALKYKNIKENSSGEKTTETTVQTLAKKSKPPGEKEKKLKNELAAINSQEELTNREVSKTARLNRKILKEQYKDTVYAPVVRNNYKVKELKDTLSNDYAYWDSTRVIPLTPDEMASYAMSDTLMAMKLNKTDSTKDIKPVKRKTMFRKIATGDYDLAKDSALRLSYDGVLSFKNFDFNTVDGYKYQQKMEFGFKLDSGKSLVFTPVIGYAINRNATFATLNGIMRDILWKKSTLKFGFGIESRDFKTTPPGIHHLLNAASAWFFGKNYMKLYETSFLGLNLSHRLNDKITLTSTVDYNHFVPLENTVYYLFNLENDYEPNLPPDFTSDSKEITEQKSFEYSVGVNWYKRQRKPWIQESPFIFIKDYYNVNLTFKQGVKNVFSSVSNFSHIDFEYRQQANISPSAGVDLHANAGYFFNSGQMHFSQFKHFKTNEIPVMLNFYTHSFQLVNDYALSTNKSFVNLGGEIRSEYLLLRYLSIVNTRTWSESFHLNYIATPDIHHYWEAGYSLNSLFFVGNLGVFTGFEGSKFQSVMVKLSISGY